MAIQNYINRLMNDEGEYMAQRGRPKGSKNKTTKARAQSVKTSEAQRNKDIIWSAVLIVVGILMYVLMAVSDKGLIGGWFQDGMHFLFSWVMYLWPLLVMYVGLLLAFDKSRKYIAMRFWCGVLALLILSALVVIISASHNSSIDANQFDNFAQVLEKHLDANPENYIGFGIGWVFTKLLGKVGGIIALLLFFAASLMVAAGKTVVNIYYWLKDKLTLGSDDDNYEEDVDTAVARIGKEQQKEARKRRPQIDIPVLDGPPPSDDGDLTKTPTPKAEIKIDDIIAKATSNNTESNQNTVSEVPAAKPTTSAIHAKDIEKDAKETEVKSEPPRETVREATENYSFPPLSLLKKSVGGVSEDMSNELKANSEKLVRTLKSFGVSTTMSEVHCGPSVTRYELQPNEGVKVSKITGLADDLALALAAESVRIEAPIPNKPAVGIEVPNKKRYSVLIRDLLETKEFADSHSRLTVALGKGISGEPVITDLAQMPHMLIAGATGSGKSVCINSIIMSILYKASPDEVKFVLIDPKAVELTVYNGIPHLAIPVVTDPKRAAGALDWAVREMLQRYKTFSEIGVRDIKGYNLYVKEKEDMEPMKQYVIIIDELYYLMMAAAKEVEDSICKLAQLARAAGMHLVIATQRPSVDVITGLIKANIPSRVALSVTSQIDSRTIIDHGGAEKLLGKGDMLFAPIDASKAQRVQGCFISDDDVHAVVNYIKEKSQASYSEDIDKAIDDYASSQHDGKSTGGYNGDVSGDGDVDEMLEPAIEIAVEAQTISTSLLQRRLKLGYARAARLVDEMEARGIVGPFEGSKPRQVLLSREQWMEMKNRQ